MATRHRPRRGPEHPNPIVSGDTGPRQPQGGARALKEAWRESGDLESREYGVPQADIPGGVRHLVNAETIPTPTVDKGIRPADYHKYHGVESDDGQYYDTPDESTDKLARPEKPTPEPKIHDSVPVHIVEAPDAKHPIRALITEGPVVIAAATVDPFRLADRDRHRLKFWICNENTQSAAGAATPGVRIGDYETCADLRGLLIPAATIKDFISQDSIYVTNQSGTAVTISWGYETEIEETAW